MIGRVGKQNQSPVNMFGANMMMSNVRKVGSRGGMTIGVADVSTADLIHEKTEPSEPVSIPSVRNRSPLHGDALRGGGGGGGRSPRGGSPQNGSFYAGAKFSEPPSPAALPEPPSHWFISASECRREIFMKEGSNDKYQVISNELKMLLKISA